MSPFASWVLLLMTSLRIQYGEQPAPWAETYPDTAAAIATTCEARPMPGLKKDQCAAVYVDLGWHESRWQIDAVHDHGAGYGLFGTHAGTLGRPVPFDAQGQAWAVNELLDTSWRICAKHPLEDRLGWYAHGATGCEHRLELSRFRMHEAAHLLRDHPYPGDP